MIDWEMTYTLRRTVIFGFSLQALETNLETYLARIGIGSTVSHTENPCPCVLERGMDFIVEFIAIYGTSSSTCAGRISSLKHKIWNNPVEDLIVIITTLGQCGEILAGLYVLSREVF